MIPISAFHIPLVQYLNLNESSLLAHLQEKIGHKALLSFMQNEGDIEDSLQYERKGQRRFLANTEIEKAVSFEGGGNDLDTFLSNSNSQSL